MHGDSDVVHTPVALNEGGELKSEHLGKPSWKIAAMRGVLSRPHIDAGGVGTMIEVLFGVKAWAVYTGKPNLETYGFTDDNPNLEGWEVVILFPGDKLLV